MEYKIKQYDNKNWISYYGNRWLVFGYKDKVIYLTKRLIKNIKKGSGNV